MNPCDEFSVKASSYAENTLHEPEREAFREHLQTCADCRAVLQAERDLSRLLRRSRPLYSASNALRASVAAALHRHAAQTHASARFPELALQTLQGWGALLRLSRLGGAASGLVVLGLLLAAVPNVVLQVRAANYVDAAVAAHRSYLNGDLALGVHSNSPDSVSSWFSGKVPFRFRLPTAEFTPESGPSYQLTGASLVQYRGKSAALVSYQKQNERISLLVASADSAVVAGGDKIRFGDLTFHYNTDQGFKVVTWTNHGLSYALVSSVSGSARESCMVCHQSMADHHNFSSSEKR